jgi:hypothetical protein
VPLHNYQQIDSSSIAAIMSLIHHMSSGSSPFWSNAGWSDSSLRAGTQVRTPDAQYRAATTHDRQDPSINQPFDPQLSGAG